MKLLRRKADPNTPGQLASEFAAAKAARDERVAQAENELAATREDVITRGTQRIQEIAQLQAELAAEQTELDSVVSQVR